MHCAAVATQESGLGAKKLELAEAKDELQKGLEAAVATL